MVITQLRRAARVEDLFFCAILGIYLVSGSLYFSAAPARSQDKHHDAAEDKDEVTLGQILSAATAGSAYVRGAAGIERSRGANVR